MRSDPKPITIFLTDDMISIIDKWGNKDKSPDNFIFPVLEGGITPLRQYEPALPATALYCCVP